MRNTRWNTWQVGRMGPLGRRGSSYAEYFLIAGLMAAAAMALWDGGNFLGARDVLLNRSDAQMNQIAGSVTPDALP